MKKSLLYIVGLIAMVVISCTDEAIIEQSGNELRITGSVALYSRTSYVEGDGVIETHWSVNDDIGLYTDVQSNLNYRAKNEGKSTEFQRFNGKLNNEEGKMVYAYYPYDYYADGEKVHLPYNNYQAIYHQLENPRPFLYSKAQITGNTLNFQFKHLFAYLQLKISVQDIKKQLAATQEFYPNDEVTTKGGWIEINSDNYLSSTGRDSYFDIKTEELSGTFSNSIWIYLDNIDFNSDNAYSFLIPILPQPGGAKISGEINFYLKSGSVIPKPLNVFKKTVSKDGLKAGNVYVWEIIGDNLQIKKTRKLLEAFYQKTGGEQWLKNDNWLSDKPFDNWLGINSTFSNQNSNDVLTLHLQDNKLSGTFPDELADIMDLVGEGWYNAAGDYIAPINLMNNLLYGSIPNAVKNHKLWEKVGWDIVTQIPTEEGELDLSNSNLYVDDIQVEDLFSDNPTTVNLHEIFKKNKLTQIINCSERTVEEIQEYITDRQINLILDYQNKGLGTLIFCGTLTEEKEKIFKKEISKIYGEINGIQWLRGKTPIRNHGSTYIFDRNGQLVSIGMYNTFCGNQVLDFNRSAAFLRSQFGEPEEHPIFTSEIYTSSDYSQDGEYITLQSATEGIGINLVFLGEAFVDKDMTSGGLYEQTMKEAMEQFFSYEPYKSFRNRFNVYAVKAISPNSACIEGATQAINHSNNKCFEYAENIPDVDKHPLMVTVVYKKVIWDSYKGRSHCYMYDDGSFVAYLYQGLDDASILMHETGGHGFGQLLDEYVEYEYKSSTLPDNKKVELDNIWSLYGQGANVDWRDNASTVKWSHFLNDSRYNNEGLGLYEGAYLYGYGAYRPTEHSMMRYNNAPFNAPSREAIYKRIMQRSEGDSWTYDYEEFVKYDEKNRNVASRSAAKPLTEAEKREYTKKHCPPTFIKGTWRDAMKNGKDNIVVPLR